MRRTLDEYIEMLEEKINLAPQALIEELLLEDDPRFVELIWPRIMQHSRYVQISFARFLLERGDTSMMVPALHLLEEDDLLLNLIAMEMLSNHPIPGRELVILDCLDHPRLQIQVVAVRLCARLALRESISHLLSFWANPLLAAPLRRECSLALGQLLKRYGRFAWLMGWKQHAQ